MKRSIKRPKQIRPPQKRLPAEQPPPPRPQPGPEHLSWQGLDQTPDQIRAMHEVRTGHAVVAQQTNNQGVPIVAPTTEALDPLEVRARTKIGRTVLRNEVQIIFSVALVLSAIEDRIKLLKDQLPNSFDAKAALKDEIEQYKQLKKQLEAFHEATLNFSTMKIDDPVMESKAILLQQGLWNWWGRNHVKICDDVYGLLIFGSAVGICLLAGAPGPFAAVIGGVVAKGKPVADALKAAAGLMTKPKQ